MPFHRCLALTGRSALIAPIRTDVSSARSFMNRPRNRQPRPPRDQQRGGRRGGGGTGHNQPRVRPAYSSVPNAQQVIPGAVVSIILKQDQPTGREVQGIVQDLLTRGDHPRGIKVRMQDGQVGRVQRMVDMNSTVHLATSSSGPSQPVTRASENRSSRSAETEALPPRTLADFLPKSDEEDPVTQPQANEATFRTASANCPICGLFEGDEIAVSRHVESHFS